MSRDPSSTVRLAVVAAIRERPHPDHLNTLIGLMQDQWSSADAYSNDEAEYSIARDAVSALAKNAPLADTVGEMLLDLADKTEDRTLSRIALTTAVNSCSVEIQRKVWRLVSLPGVRWIRLDAMVALADAEALDPTITAHLTPDFFTDSPPILAVHAAHLIGAQATAVTAMQLFTSIASLNRFQVLLLVGANSMVSRDPQAADQILDLLENGHPARHIVDSPEPLPASTLNDLGSVALREHARKLLGKRFADNC